MMRKRRGILIIEMVVALGLAAMLAALMGQAVSHYRNARAHYAWRRAAAWAADAQVQRIRGGAAYASQPPAGLIAEEIVLDTQVQPGTGPWMGFDRVTVTARVAPRRGRAITEQSHVYMARGITP